MGFAAIDRRALLKGAGAGLLIPLLPNLPAVGAAAASAPLALNAWVRVGADSRVTIILSQTELGQGISTTLPAILADELGADWAAVTIEHAPVAPEYRNPRFNFMFTGNSESIQTFSGPMRLAGAQAREMLTSAAAKRLGVEPAALKVAGGKIRHEASGKEVSFGDVAADAAKLPLPEKPTLRPDAEATLVGRALPRLDIPAKVNGDAIYGLDFKVEGMAYAALMMAPTIGGKVKSVDDAKTKTMPGVIAVIPLEAAVAVVAERYWQARAALESLKVEFDPGPNAAITSATLKADRETALAGTDFGPVTNLGDAVGALAAAKDVVTARYEAPFEAHATMEPMNCTAHVTTDKCTVWAPTQGPELTKIVASAVSGLPPEKVEVHWTLSGGGFGRRLLPDFVVQAVILSKATGRPVKVVWSRENDYAADFYRPATLAELRGTLGADGLPTAFAAKLVSASQLQAVAGTPLPPHVDPRVTEGLDRSRYAIANHRLDYHKQTLTIPTAVLRTTGFGPNIFAFESFIDELAHKAGVDPYQYRRKLLAKDARALAVLDKAAAAAGWDKPLPKGRGRGIAFTDAFETLVAVVVELEVTNDKTIRLGKVVMAADPGKIFDPGITESNLQGGIVWGLNSALASSVTFEGGGVVERNFDAFPGLVRLASMPAVEVHLIAGDGEKIGGIGEAGPCAVPAAVANAVFAATGERVRALPLTSAGFSAGDHA